MGAIDENGIYQYTEDDLAAPGGLFSGLLNKLAGTVSTVVGALASRVTTVEKRASPTSFTSDVVTAGDGWKLLEQGGTKVAGMAFVFFRVERTGAAITVPDDDGNIADQLIATLTAAWTPAAPKTPSSTYTGRVATSLTLGNDVYMAAVAPPADIITGENFAFALVFPLA